MIVDLKDTCVCVCVCLFVFRRRSKEGKGGNGGGLFPLPKGLRHTRRFSRIPNADNFLKELKVYLMLTSSELQNVHFVKVVHTYARFEGGFPSVLVNF